MTDMQARTDTDTPGDSTPQAHARLDAVPEVVARGRMSSRLGSVHAGLIASAAVLVLLLVFILENAHSVNVGFLGAHLHLPLAVALLLAGVGGALLVGALGAARITQLRRTVHREVHRFDQPR